MGYESQVTFNGIPFLLDEATVVRMPHPSKPPNAEQPNELLPPRKHQPESKLIDEINRLMDLGYIQDQAYPSNYPGRNLSALAKQWPINQWPMTKFKLGSYFYPHGASRWSVYRGLMASSQVKSLLASTMGQGAYPFVMQANIGSDNTSLYQIKTNLSLLPPRCLAELGGSFDGLYLVTLVDERYYWQGKYVTLRVDNSTTWTQLGQQVCDALGLVITFPVTPPIYSKPEPDSQLWCNQENAAVLFDAIAYNIGTTVVRQYSGEYNLFQPEHSRSVVYSNNRFGNPSVLRTAGGDIFSSGENIPAGNLTASMNAVLPDHVAITFPKYVVGDDPVPHFVNPRYANPRPTSWYEESYGDTWTLKVPLLSGSIQFSGHLGFFVSGSAQLDSSGNPYTSSGLIGSPYTLVLRETAKALYDTSVGAVSGSAPLNASGLTYLGMQLAYDVFARQIAVALDETYPGVVAWQPEGVHDLLFTYSARERQATTRVIRPQWNQLIPDLQHATPLISGMAYVPGQGGPSVAQTWRDSFSGKISTTLLQTYSSGETSLEISDASYLPTQNRWKARISSGQADNEVMLLEGTSGGTAITVVQQGVDGTAPNSHDNGSVLSYVAPNTTYGVNSVRFDKGQFTYFDDWKSGGIQGVVAIPQTQTVRVYDGSGTLNPAGGLYYSGCVVIADKTQQTFQELEKIWIVERNSNYPLSGYYYDGQLFAYSTQPTDNPDAPIVPVYLINTTGSGTTASFNQTWQDSYSGFISTTLIETYSSGQAYLAPSSISSLPTQNRWVARISSGQTDDEQILLNGTSGSVSGGLVPIVQRGYNSTTLQDHANGASLIYVVPDKAASVDKIVFEKGQFIYPQEISSESGSKTGVHVVPQIQTVQVLSSGYAVINGVNYYSGRVTLLDPIHSGATMYWSGGLEYCWVFERTGLSGATLLSQITYAGQSGGIPLTSGKYYPGQFVGWSVEDGGGQTAPVYTVSEYASGPAPFAQVQKLIETTVTTQDGNSWKAYPSKIQIASGNGWASPYPSGWLTPANGNPPALLERYQGTVIANDASGVPILCTDDSTAIIEVSTNSPTSVTVQGGLGASLTVYAGAYSCLDGTSPLGWNTSVTSQTVYYLPTYSGEVPVPNKQYLAHFVGIANDNNPIWAGTTPKGWTAGYVDNTRLVSGMELLRFDGSGFLVSGYSQSGTFDVYHAYGLSGDIKPVAMAASPGTLGRVARADHVHSMSGAITSGMIVSGAINIYNFFYFSGSIYSGSFASGVLPGTINQDGSQFTYPAILTVAANSYSGQQYGRIVLTNLTNGLLSNSNAISGVSQDPDLKVGSPWATQIDWQGIRNYHQGNGWYGPQPDLETIDTNTIEWSGGVDSGTQCILLQANIKSGVLLTTKNVDGTDQVAPTYTLIADNFTNVNLSGNNTFGRIKFTSSGSAISGQANTNLIDWQGLEILTSGPNTYGPEPDIYFEDSSDIVWEAVDEPANKYVKVNAFTAGPSFFISGVMLTSGVCNTTGTFSGQLTFDVANFNLTIIDGLVQSGFFG